MTCETVAVDTPDNLATSFILTPLIREAFPFSLRSVWRRNVGREEAAFVIPPLRVKTFLDQCCDSLPHMKFSFFLQSCSPHTQKTLIAGGFLSPADFLGIQQTTGILPPPAQAVSRPPVHARNPIGQPPEVIRAACPSRLGTTLRMASVLPQ